MPSRWGIQELPEGRLIIDFYGEHSPFLFVDDDCLPRYIEVIDSMSEVMVWTKEELATVYEKRTNFRQYVIEWLRYKQSALIERLAEWAAYNTEDRIRFALLRLGRQFGVKTPEGTKLPRFTHKNLADYVSTSRELTTHI